MLGIGTGGVTGTGLQAGLGDDTVAAEVGTGFLPSLQQPFGRG